MGGAISLNPKFQTLTTFTTLILITPSIVNGEILPFATFEHDTATTSSPPGISTNNNSSTLRQVLIGVLVGTFSLLFLILLYIKYCKKGGGSNVNDNANSQPKHSGIDHDVLESIPLFRFGSLKGEKDGLECAVCLTKFEDHEILRLLPKCKHAFHGECLDTWLHTHSTCPLCRTKVDPDCVIVIDEESAREENESDIESGRNDDASSQSGRNDDASSQGRESQAGTVTSLDGVEHRIEHRIIVSPTREGVNQRWNDFQRDVLYLTPDMITWKARGGRGRMSDNINTDTIISIDGNVNNLRSVSDATGMTSGQNELRD